MDIETYSKYTHFYSGNVPKLLLKYLNKYTWKSFLDVGCGDGALLFALNERHHFYNKMVYGIDLSLNRINRGKKINPNFKLFVDSAANMQCISDNSIDFLVSTQVVEHVPSDEGMIKEISRVLNKENNIVYISTVFKKWYGWYFYRCNNKWTLDPTHLREYTSDDQLFRILQKNSFSIIESRKSLFWFTISHFFLRKMGIQNKVNNPFWKLVSLFKVPIIGYYNWEIVCRKK